MDMRITEEERGISAPQVSNILTRQLDDALTLTIGDDPNVPKSVPIKQHSTNGCSTSKSKTVVSMPSYVLKSVMKSNLLDINLLRIQIVYNIPNDLEGPLSLVWNSFGSIDAQCMEASDELAAPFSLQAFSAQVWLDLEGVEQNKELDDLIKGYSQLKLDHDLLKVLEGTLHSEAERCKKDLIERQEKMVECDNSLQTEIVQRNREIKELRMKLDASDAEVVHLLNASKDIELEIIVKVRATLLQQFKEGNTTEWDPEKARRQ